MKLSGQPSVMFNLGSTINEWSAKSARLTLCLPPGLLFPACGASTWGGYFLDANGWNLRYSPRWESDAGVHVSIEDSNQLPGLVPGYLVVVIASGTPSEIWPIARRASAAGIKAHVRYTRRLVRVCPY